MSEAVSFPARARIVDAAGIMTPEFFRALQSVARNASQPVGAMYLAGNASATTCTPTPVKIDGTTTAGELYAFDHATGRLTYTGALAKVLAVTVFASFTTASGKVGIGVSVNGAATMSYATATAGFISAQVAVELKLGDYIEAVVSNAASSAVTVTDLQLVAR